MKNNSKIPVVLITGYLGSGKTTLLNELLKQEKRKIALVVNDMGSINVDAKLLRQGSVNALDTKVIELSNGCICCTLRDEFMVQMEEISKQKDIEAVFVEASGISDPASIADAFLSYEEMKRKTRIYLSSIVTVVDADRVYCEFLADIVETQKTLKNPELSEAQKTQEVADVEDNSNDESETDSDIINLVMDQIEFCNIVVLNKCDLLSSEKINEVKKVIHELQSKAEIIESKFGKVDADSIINGERFDYDEVMDSSLVQRTLKKENRVDDGVFVDECGITSFVYEEKRPFDYEKLMSFIENDYPETLIRAKGYVWFADDYIHAHLFEQAGRNATVTEMSNWVASFTEKEQKEVFENYPDVLEDWDEKYGDRCNQIVFIGKGYDKKRIVEMLNGCIA